MNLLFVLKNCPYCIQALQLMDEVVAESPHLAMGKNSLRVVDERKESGLANTYDYFYVPTFYSGKKKLHEGPVSKNDVFSILKTLSAQA